MAITVDSVGSADGDGTTVTLSHTITAVGSDLMLTVGSAAEVNVNQDVTITGVTWNGTSLIAIGNADFDNTSSATFRDTATLWYLINPDTGTHDVVATCATDPKGMTVGAISLIGAKQQAPEASATNKDALVVSGRASVTLSSISDNAWFVDSVANHNSGTDMVADANQDERYQDANDIRHNGSTRSVISASEITMGWTLATSRFWGIVCGVFAPAVAAAGWTHIINTVTAANMAKVNTVAKANIAEINQT